MTNHYIRRKSQQLGTVAMAFDVAAPEHPAQQLTILQFTTSFAEKLSELQQKLLQRKSNLRIENLRGRWHLADQRLLRLQLDARNLPYTYLLTPTFADEAVQRFRLAVDAWLNEQVADSISDDSHEQQLFRDLKALSAKPGGVFNVSRRSMQAFDWKATQRQTVQAGHPGAFADLADYVALQLEGQSLWASQQPMRLLANSRADSGKAYLISEPLTGGQFSYVVTVQVLTFALYDRPMVNIQISKRNWLKPTAKAKSFVRNKNLSAYAFPQGSSRVLPFTLRRKQIKSGSWEFETGEDYAAIARTYGLPLRLTLSELLKMGRSYESCQLLVNVKNGVAQKDFSQKVGVTNDDKLEAIRAMQPILAAAGLRLNESFLPVPTGTRDRLAHQKHQLYWSLSSSPAKRKLWQEETFSHIKQLYQGKYKLLLAYQSEHQADAKWLEEHVKQLFTAENGEVHIEICTVKLPPGVHGPREEGTDSERRERQAGRWRDWLPSLNDFPQLADIDGVMVLAQQWYGNQPDDKFNKRIARHYLTTHFNRPVQFLRPRVDLDSADDKDFERNFMMGWMDLAYQSKGRVTPWTLASAALEIFDRRLPQDLLFKELHYPDEVMALGVISKNKSQFGNTKGSVFPYAIRLNIATGICQARIAHVHPVTGLDLGEWLPMDEALTYISSLGEIRIHQMQRGQRPNEIRKKQSDNIQQFFNLCLIELNRNTERPLVFVDADTSKTYWPWLTDRRIDPDNVHLVNHHAQGNWPKVRLVRVRTNNSPKILISMRHSAESANLVDGEVEPTGSKAATDGTNPAATQLYQLADTSTFISFGRRRVQRPVIGSNIHAKRRFKKLPTKYPLRGTGELITVYNYLETPASKDQWATPNGVEFMVVLPAGEDPVRLATLSEWLRQNYAHINEWTEQPAPLSFARKLKEYVFDMAFEDWDNEEEAGQ